MKQIKSFTSQYPRLHKLIWDLEFIHIRLIFLALFVFLVQYFFYLKKEKAFEETAITIAIVEKVDFPLKRKRRSIRFYYVNESNQSITIDNKFNEYETLNYDCFSHRKPGDTIVVEYSLTNPKYARIISCFWNDNVKKKYGYYKWN
jgi:hypothetical protein